MRVGCKHAEDCLLLLDVDVMLRQFVYPEIIDHGVPLRTELQQKALSAYKRRHHMHDTARAWLTVCLTNAAHFYRECLHRGTASMQSRLHCVAAFSANVATADMYR